MISTTKLGKALVTVLFLGFVLQVAALAGIFQLMQEVQAQNAPASSSCEKVLDKAQTPQHSPRYDLPSGAETQEGEGAP